MVAATVPLTHVFAHQPMMDRYGILSCTVKFNLVFGVPDRC